MTSTITQFGVPLGGGAGRGGILQPKTKHKFRVKFVNFGPVAGGIELSQQVISAGRPQVQSSPVEVHSYNSIMYYAGKATWSSIQVRLRDDVTNSVTKLVGHQEQKQTNHLMQTTPLAGSNYKFTTILETLDGGDDAVLDRWTIENCFLENVEWGDNDYSSAEPIEIGLTIRYDNAVHEGDLFPLQPEIGTGNFL